MLAGLAILGGSVNAYTLTPDVLGVRSTVRSNLRIAMMADEPVPMNPIWGDPREGKPFGAADRDESAGGSRTVGGVREAVEAYQPRGITDATILKKQYIGTDDDEPWNADCRATVLPTKSALEDGYTATLPFITAEAALEGATRAAKKAGEVKSAIEAAKKAGGRPGSPAFVAAEKVLAAFEKGDEEAATKAKPKAPKDGAQGKGWDDMGRGLAKVHDNSIA